MNAILKIFLSAAAVVILAKLLPGVSVTSYLTAIFVAVVISGLNFFARPILIILTLPVTILTFGLFLLIINAVIILLADAIVRGFDVENIWWALLFSLLLSILQSILYSLLKSPQKRKIT